MADAKISALTALASGHATGDLIPIVDVSDTTQAASGTTKKTTIANLFANLPSTTVLGWGGGTTANLDYGVTVAGAFMFTKGGGFKFAVDSSGPSSNVYNFGSYAGNTTDACINRPAAGILGICGSSTTTGGALEFIEQTAPSAPSANRVRLYAQDNGAGKTQLMALFNTGAAQQVAIEP